MKKILINSYYFFPENTPRAFRSTELATALADMGYDITISLPARYKRYEKNIKEKTKINSIIFCGKKMDNNKNIIEEDKILDDNKIKKHLSKLVRYFLSDKNIFYALNNYFELKKEKKQYDCLISIGLPFSVHIGSYLISRKSQIKVIADYGDPFSCNPAVKLAPYFKRLEQVILKRFNYITIPTELSIKYYKEILDDIEKINIIPQGFNMDNQNISSYTKNDICKFAYAGIFYEKIRNPKELFDKLALLNKDFEFHIYTNLGNMETVKCLQHIPENIKDKIKIHGLLPREECINELSKYEFLINLENENSGQVASKVIDYSLAQRPILSINKGFDINSIVEFIDGKYDKRLIIDLEKYNIKNVSKKFKILIEDK